MGVGGLIQSRREPMICIRCQIAKRYTTGAWGKGRFKPVDGKSVYGPLCPICAEHTVCLGYAVTFEPLPGRMEGVNASRGVVAAAIGLVALSLWG